MKFSNISMFTVLGLVGLIRCQDNTFLQEAQQLPEQLTSAPTEIDLTIGVAPVDPVFADGRHLDLSFTAPPYSKCASSGTCYLSGGCCSTGYVANGGGSCCPTGYPYLAGDGLCHTGTPGTCVVGYLPPNSYTCGGTTTAYVSCSITDLYGSDTRGYRFCCT